jgi:hypothetical protein
MRSALVAVVVTMMLPAAAVGQTAQEQRACVADVMRLCATAIPQRARVISCVLRKQAQLGSECRAVVARYTGKSGPGDKPASEHAVSLRQ